MVIITVCDYCEESNENDGQTFGGSIDFMSFTKMGNFFENQMCKKCFKLAEKLLKKELKK